MTNSLNNNKKNDSSKINIDTIVAFCKKNIKYISAGILTVILVVVLAVTAINSGKSEDKKEKAQTEEQKDGQAEKYEVNKNEDLNKLVKNYYKWYAEGNVKKIAKIAEPLSDMEKSYIKMMSGYVESYENIDCYTKKGLDDSSFMVSVTFDMKFEKTDGALPGMEFFYVKTKEDGTLFIDNLYSSFNSEMKEKETDTKIAALIEEFKKDADVKELQADFQSKYTKAVAEDKKLQKKVDKVTAGIKDWAASYVAADTDEEKTDEEKAAEDQKKADEQKAAEDQKKADEQKAAEDKKKADEKKAAEEKKKADEKKAAEDKKKADEQKAAEDKKKADEQKAAEEQNNQQDNNDNSGLNYVPEGTVLTANDGYNVRVSMSETSDIVGTVAIGDSIKVVLSYQEGWTKVEWNGKTGFIKTELLLNN